MKEKKEENDTKDIYDLYERLVSLEESILSGEYDVLEKELNTIEKYKSILSKLRNDVYNQKYGFEKEMVQQNKERKEGALLHEIKYFLNDLEEQSINFEGVEKERKGGSKKNDHHISFKEKERFAFAEKGRRIASGRVGNELGYFVDRLSSKFSLGSKVLRFILKKAKVVNR